MSLPATVGSNVSGMLRSRPTASLGTRRFLIGAGTVVGLLALWEAAADLAFVNPMLISSPSRVVAAGIEPFASGDIWQDIKVSALEFAWGYFAAIVVGIPLGLATGWNKRVNYLCGPFIDMLNAVPRVTFLPILILWFGIGIWSKVAVAFLGAVIPIAIATHTGVRTNEARFIRVARSFCASRTKLFTSIILPGTVPYLFTGLKYGAGRALLGVVVGEIYASTVGVGHMISDAANLFDTSTVFLGVVMFMAAGVTVTTVLNRIERHFDRWRPEAQRL
ncbi:MAG TPA: ABC transporter permease [Xanthobacteraceae bacterium]|nr:ABC transporter permease [Xanthobacteraceae bacterium]